MNAYEIKYENSVVTLGFHINSMLDCTSHINNAISKIYNILRKLWHTADYIPESTRLKLVKTFIVPIISYFELIYGCLDYQSANKLKLALNNCARYVYNKKKYDHISHLTLNILGFDVQVFLNYRNLIFMHKLINSKRPEPLFCRLQFSQSNRTLNLIVPRFKYLNASRLFFINTVKPWNTLPVNLKRIVSTELLIHFKNENMQ